MGIGLLQGLGFAAGGAAQGGMQAFNASRQNAIQQAYLKIQQQNQERMDKQLAREQALDPVKQMAAHPDTASVIGPAYNEALQFNNDPEHYSYQPPDVPQPDKLEEMAPGVQGPPAMIPQSPVHPDPVPGARGYAEYLANAGKAARDAQIDAENRKFQHQMELMQGQLGLVYPKAYLGALGRTEGGAANLDTVRATAEAKAAGTAAGGLPYVAPKAAAAAAATGKIQVPEGVDVPAPAGPGAGGAGGGGGKLNIPTVQRQPTATQQAQLGDLDTAISFVDSLAKTAGKGGPGTETGSPQAWWTAHAGRWASTPLIGDAIQKIDPHIQDRAAFHEALGQNLLTTLRTVFKGRISNFDVVFGQDVIPNARDSDQVRNSKLNELSARLHAARSMLAAGNTEAGVASGAPVTLTIPPEGMMGKVGPATPPAPAAQAPVAPAGTLNMPGAQQNGLGVYPVPPPTDWNQPPTPPKKSPFKTFIPD